MQINPQPQPIGAQQFEVVEPGAIESISRAEIDMTIATARRYPRQLSVVKQKMLSFATLDQETAESCFYTLPRGGKNIQGPSVRLAEIAVACYQNLRAGSRIISTQTTGDNPHVVIQAVAMDLENNISITIEKRRRIIGKKSAGGAISEDDINLSANAGSAIAFRDAVFKIVPLALIKPVFEAARKVAIGDAKTLVDRRAKCLDTFAKMGIAKERVIFKLDKKSVDDIGLEDLETLIGLYNAIKEGEVSLDEAFPTATKPANLTPITSTSAPQPAKDATAVPKPQMAEPAAQTPPAPASATAEPQGEASPQEQAPEPSQEAAKPQEPASEPPSDPAECVKIIEANCERDGVTAGQVIKFLYSVKVADPAKHKELGELSTAKLQRVVVKWADTLEKIKAIQA